MPLSYLFSAELSDTGRKRKNNEDAVVRLPEHGIFCVADGMGGGAHGEIASRAVVDELRRSFGELAGPESVPGLEGKARLVEKALSATSLWIKRKAEELGARSMGTTAVVLAFDAVVPGRAMTLHAGDSRAYRLRGDKLEPLTRDHTVAEAAGVDSEKLPLIFRGVITRAVGVMETVDVERTPTDVRSGDIFLLCSDGLSRMLPDTKLLQILKTHKDDALDDLARTLVGEANDAGGMDNVSVVLVRVGDMPQPPARDPSDAARTDATSKTSETDETADTPRAATEPDEESTPAGGALEGMDPAPGSNPRFRVRSVAFLVLAVAALAACMVLFLVMRSR